MIRRLRAPSVRIARRRPRSTPTPAETPAPTETPAAVVDDGHRTPSYMYKLNESKRLKLLLNEHDHRQRIRAHNNKRDGEPGERRRHMILDVVEPCVADRSCPSLSDE